MRFVVSAMLLSGLLGASPVLAQTSRSAEDIVTYFADSIELGATRGICVGTEEECANRTAAVPRAGLDMLINFDLDSSELSPEARAQLAEFARALRDNRLRAHNFVVEGHTDARGSDSYNIGLSERRANAVASFLLAHGIETTRITAVGLGKANPRVDDPLDPINRRVEMRLNQ